MNNSALGKIHNNDIYVKKKIGVCVGAPLEGYSWNLNIVSCFCAPGTRLHTLLHEDPASMTYQLLHEASGLHDYQLLHEVLDLYGSSIDAIVDNVQVVE